MITKLHLGDKIVHCGQIGFIIEIYEGMLKGMVMVRMPTSCICMWVGA